MRFCIYYAAIVAFFAAFVLAGWVFGLYFCNREYLNFTFITL